MSHLSRGRGKAKHPGNGPNPAGLSGWGRVPELSELLDGPNSNLSVH